MFALLTALSLLGLSAFAEDTEPPIIEIISKPLARWDDTRWRVDMQLGVPYPVVLYAPTNEELQVVAMDVRLVFHCNLDGEVVRGRGEATCEVEDAAISAAPWNARVPQADTVLQDTDRLLSSLRFQLQVDGTGRVLNVGLLGEPQTNERINTIYENLRQIITRAVIGFHIQAPETYTVGRDLYERNTRLMTLPSFRYSVPSLAAPLRPPNRLAAEGPAFYAGEGSPYGQPRQPGMLDQATQTGPVEVASFVGTQQRYATQQMLGPFSSAHPMDVLIAPASYGRNNVVHRLDAYKGSYVVQSVGEGTADIGVDIPIVYMGDMTAVAVFNPDRGYMTERRWTVSMSPTASSLMSDGVAGWPYWQIGSLQLLGPEEESPLGPSVVVAPPHEERGQLPPWPTL